MWLHAVALKQYCSKSDVREAISGVVLENIDGRLAACLHPRCPTGVGGDNVSLAMVVVNHSLSSHPVDQFDFGSACVGGNKLSISVPLLFEALSPGVKCPVTWCPVSSAC